MSIIANMKAAIQNRETATIGGGEFSPEELKTLVTMLKDCEYAFNCIPNTKLPNGTRTYDLASRISKL